MKRLIPFFGFIVALAISTVLAVILVTAVTTVSRWATSSNDKAWKEVAERVEKQKSYNLTHPLIVGTNENGEIIKRYDIPINQWTFHYVYEVGNTKTVNNDLGKFGMQVTVEKQ